MRGSEVLNCLFSAVICGVLSCGGSAGQQAGDDPGSAGGPPASPSSGGLSADGFPSSGGGLAAGAAAFTPPEGVDAKLWQALNAALAREIARYSVGADCVRPSADARSASLRRTSAPPTGTGAVVGDLALTANADGSAGFGWSYRCPGDYDQNGEVNLADLTPVGVGYGKSSSESGWAKYEPADGDGNGEVNLADVTPIGANFGATFEGYELQHSATPANEPSWQATGAEAPLSSATAPPGGGRKAFSLTIPAGDPSLVDNEYFRVRGYVGSGAGRQYGAPSISVQYHPGAPPVVNQPPIAVLDIEPSSGLAPLDVLLDATSSGDIDGEIVKYEFDADGPLNGEAWTDMGPGGILPFSYLGSGDFLCALRVTDDGGATDTDLALVKSRDPNPPSAALTAAALSGPTPLHVVWDASGSADTDGLVVRYEWDFDADGEYEYDSGPVPTADFYYYEPGDFPVRVRVTDNDGLSNSTTNQASATLGASWHVQGLPYVPTDSGTAELIEAQGKPGIFIRYDNGVDGDNVYFVLGTDEEASGWLDPVSIGPDLAGGDASSGLAIASISGRPAVANSGYFVLAADTSGQSWGTEFKLLPEPPDMTMIYAQSMVLAQNKPLILAAPPYGIVRAKDTLGAGFEYPIPIYGSGWDGSLAIIGGKPALATMSGQSSQHENLKFARALDGSGSLWSPVQLIDLTICADPNLMDADGFPAVAYYDDDIKAIKFIRAEDGEGEDWSKPQVLYQPASSSLDSFLLAGRPALVFQDTSSRDFRFMCANDQAGRSWSLPTTIASAIGLALDPASIGAATISGMPSASFVTNGIDGLRPWFAQYR